MTRSVLGIDGNVLLQKLWHSQDHDPQSMIPLVEDLMKCAAIQNDDDVTVVFDHGRSAKRRKWIPDYKGNRPAKSTDQLLFFARGKQTVADKWKTVMEQDTEGDDLAARLARTVPNADTVLFLWTIDHDWLQLACDDDAHRVVVIRQDYKTKENRFYTEAEATKFLGMPARRWSERAAFMGDPGDNVPALFTEAQADAILHKYRTLKNALATAPECRLKRASIIKNYLATNLLLTPEEEEEWESLLGPSAIGASL